MVFEISSEQYIACSINPDWGNVVKGSNLIQPQLKTFINALKCSDSEAKLPIHINIAKNRNSCKWNHIIIVESYLEYIWIKQVTILVMMKFIIVDNILKWNDCFLVWFYRPHWHKTTKHQHVILSFEYIGRIWQLLWKTLCISSTIMPSRIFFYFKFVNLPEG